MCLHSEKSFLNHPVKHWATGLFSFSFVSCRVSNRWRIIKLNTGPFGQNIPPWKYMAIEYLVDSTEEFPSKPTSTVFSLLKWMNAYLLIHPGKYCGCEIIKIPSLDKTFLLQHCDHGFALSIQWFFYWECMFIHSVSTIKLRGVKFSMLGSTLPPPNTSNYSHL